MNAILSEDRTKKLDSSRSTEAIPALPPPSSKDREHELTSMIKDMENKHGTYLYFMLFIKEITF